MVSALTDGSFRYLSKEEIERGSPSRQDDMGVGKEAQLQATYCSFIRDVGLRVRLTKKEGSAAFESKTSSNNLRRRKKNCPFCCNRRMGGGCALEEKRPCRRPWRACSPRMRCVGCGHGKGWEKAEEESVSSLWSIGKLGRERELRCSGGVVDEEETWWASSREGRNGSVATRSKQERKRHNLASLLRY
ncbi:uncharacterized protein LOC124656177 [Lolium rigidum]|uniref:uncharacterized protein LOC124656177 n=1 Tax=Lolium rigidum TaxID=89674 RepID=UPI001F5E32A3|nr:uncharacterized protein LOC124656177 [Lolium rigidum]